MKAKHDPGNAVLVVEFKEDLKVRNYSKSTIYSYFNNLIKFLLWTEETLDKRVKEITKEDILNYGSLLKKKGYSINTVDGTLRSIRQFFKWLEEKLYILINPAENLVMPRPPQPVPVVLTENEMKKLIDQPNTSTLIGIRDKAMLEVFYSTGIRLNEIHNLTIFDIDLQSGFLRVNKGKFSKDRFVPLTKPACYWLKEYINKARPKFTKNKPREQALFVGASWGRKINKLIIQRMVRSYVKQAGIKKQVRVHTLRHTMATHLLENNADIFKIQKLLGHTRPSTTQRYTKVHPKEIKEAHKKHHPREADKNDE